MVRQFVREKEHIAMIRENPDGSKTPLIMPNHNIYKWSSLKVNKEAECVIISHKKVTLTE